MRKKTELSEDLIVEILLRLPVKSILQCKCLSKHYYSLIGSPFFMDRHKRLVIEEDEHDMLVIRLKRDGPTIHKFSRRRLLGNTEPLDYCPNFLLDHQSFTIHGFSCSGPLAGICCVFVGGEIIVWNPATREHHLLPRLPPHLQKTPDYGNFPDLNYGFGFDRICNDYKVVLVTSYHSYGKCEPALTSRTFNLYSTLNQEWRMLVDIDGDDNKPCEWITMSSVYVNGTCHWISHRNSEDDGICYSMLTFDMSRDVVGSLPFPIGGSNYKWRHLYVVPFNESLALVNAQGSVFDLWVMKDYGVFESWTLLFQVSSSIRRMPGARFLGIVGDHFYFKEYGRPRAISCDLRSGNVKRYDIQADDIDHILPYVPTFTRISRHACVL